MDTKGRLWKIKGRLRRDSGRLRGRLGADVRRHGKMKHWETRKRPTGNSWSLGRRTGSLRGDSGRPGFEPAKRSQY